MVATRRQSGRKRSERCEIGMSGYLFARPSFLSGAASLLDIGGTLFESNWSLSPSQADKLAFRADWAAIGDDFRKVIATEAKALKKR